MSDRLRDLLVERLETENEVLRERVRQLERMLADTTQPMPVEIGLSPNEEKVLAALMARDICSRDHLMTMLYGDRIDDPPDPKIVDVLVCKLRAKLEPFGVAIETLWARGYMLKPAAKDVVRRMMEAERSSDVRAPAAAAGR